MHSTKTNLNSLIKKITSESGQDRFEPSKIKISVSTPVDPDLVKLNIPDVQPLNEYHISWFSLHTTQIHLIKPLYHAFMLESRTQYSHVKKFFAQPFNFQILCCWPDQPHHAKYYLRLEPEPASIQVMHEALISLASEFFKDFPVSNYTPHINLGQVRNFTCRRHHTSQVRLKLSSIDLHIKTHCHNHVAFSLSQ